MFKILDKKQKKISILLNAEKSNIPSLINIVIDFCDDYLNNENNHDLCVAIDEAVTNIMMHAYKWDNSGLIDFCISKEKDGIFISVKDDCQKFIPPVRITKKKVDQDKLLEGGWGLFLMKNNLDELDFIYDDINEKNIIQMKKYCE